jgi:hypothetical protein
VINDDVETGVAVLDYCLHATEDKLMITAKAIAIATSSEAVFKDQISWYDLPQTDNYTIRITKSMFN